MRPLGGKADAGDLKSLVRKDVPVRPREGLPVKGFTVVKLKDRDVLYLKFDSFTVKVQCDRNQTKDILHTCFP